MDCASTPLFDPTWRRARRPGLAACLVLGCCVALVDVAVGQPAMPAPAPAAPATAPSPQAGSALPAAFDALQSIVGRWASDPADCVANRYVWRFLKDRVGLYVDNEIVQRLYAARWAGEADTIVLEINDGEIAATYAFRFVSPDEFVTTRFVWRGQERPLSDATPNALPRKRFRWLRCP